jgi:murein L,D-transpeptidase YafK
MGNNNSMVSLMFEEIKGLLTSIDKKLNERVTVKENPSLAESKLMIKPTRSSRNSYSD